MNTILVVIVLLLTAAVIFWIFSTWHQPNVVQQQQTKKTDYVLKVNLLQSDLRDANRTRQLQIAKKLGKLYRDGVPDRYNNNNEKIKGIAPDPSKAIHYFALSQKMGSLYGLFKLARIYHFGMHNLEPNLPKALETYKQILKSPDVPMNLKQKTVDAITQLTKTLDDQKVYSWLNLPYTPPTSTKKYGIKYDVHTQPNAPMTGTGRMVGTGRMARTGTGPHAGIFNVAPKIPVTDVFRANRPQTQTQTQTHIQAQTQRQGGNRGGGGGGGLAETDEDEQLPEHQRNDMHNVHDSGVLGTIRRSIQNLQQSTKIQIPLTESLKNLRTLLNANKNDKNTDAAKALDAIERSFLPLSSTNIKEVDALHLVWNRIHDPVNKDNKDALQQNLVDELAECIEYDKPVCSTGRFTRILDTLNAVDPAVQIKPMYALKNEMMDKCVVVRKQMYDALPESEKIHIDNINENESQVSFNKQLKDEIRSQLRKDYVETQVLSPEQLDKEVNQWIDHI